MDNSRAMSLSVCVASRRRTSSSFGEYNGGAAALEWARQARAGARQPDYDGLPMNRRLIERSRGLTELSDFDYLMLAPDDRAGALGFGSSVEPPAARRRFNRTLDLAALQRAADAILDDDREYAGAAGAQAEELLLLGTSMGGARPKAVVEHEGDLWIAKFARSDDRWNDPRVEHGMLALARACGLNAAADSRIETVGGRDVLLVRRFDRDRADDGRSGAGYRRYRMVSALTLLRTGDGLADRGDWSYLLLADEVRRASARPQDDLRELFGRICFNAAVSNLDDHPRNHALLAKERQWRLSPAYDLTPSPVVALERRDLAMTCGRLGRHAARGNLLSGCGRFLLRDDEAAGMFDRIVSTVRRQWLHVMRGAGVDATDRDAIRGAFVYDGLGG